MSSRSHRSDIMILSVMGALSLTVIVALLMWGVLGGEPERKMEMRTSHSTNVEGTAVYYTLLERLGFAVSRSEHVLLAETLDVIDVLFLLNPIVPLRDDELLSLEQWVRGGGVLICGASWNRALSWLHGVTVS
ncbi:MAG: hypothetical protein JXQ73_33770, partial [Phycisphaerae bacterium]|nr:hypothetical protein [Phycisphaerae bacterium]